MTLYRTKADARMSGIEPIALMLGQRICYGSAALAREGIANGSPAGSFEVNPSTGKPFVRAYFIGRLGDRPALWWEDDKIGIAIPRIYDNDFDRDYDLADYLASARASYKEVPYASKTDHHP